MGSFKKSGHWRTSHRGNVHWVREHSVSGKLDSSINIPAKRVVPFGAISNPLSYDSYVVPNAHCPVCGEAVFYYRSPFGGRVFFDQLGPPWPKHPCTDNGLEPIYMSEGKERNSWVSAGWRPLEIFSIEWGIRRAIVTGELLSDGNFRKVVFSAQPGDAERLGGLAAVRCTKGMQGILSTAGRDGQSVIEFPIKRLPVETKLGARSQRERLKVDAEVFFEFISRDWVHVRALKKFKAPAIEGFRDGVPVLAVIWDAELDPSDQIESWLHSQVWAIRGQSYADIAWSWDRLIPPVLFLGGRQNSFGALYGCGDITSIYGKYALRCFSRDTSAIQVEPFFTSSTVAGIMPLQPIHPLPRLSKLPQCKIEHNRWYNRIKIQELAEIRQINQLVDLIYPSVIERGFKVDLSYPDGLRFIRSKADEIYVWLAYSCPKRGLLVTLSSKEKSDTRRVLEECPGTVGPTEGDGTLPDVSSKVSISRWLKSPSEIKAFSLFLGAYSQASV